MGGGNGPGNEYGAPIAVRTGRGEFAVVWNQTITSSGGTGHVNSYEVFSPTGAVVTSGQISAQALSPEAFTNLDGFRVEWDSILSPSYVSPPTAYRYAFENFGGPTPGGEGVQSSG